MPNLGSSPRVFAGDSLTSSQDKKANNGAEAPLGAHEEAEVVKDADGHLTHQSCTKDAGNPEKRQAGPRPNVSSGHQASGEGVGEGKSDIFREGCDEHEVPFGQCLTGSAGAYHAGGHLLRCSLLFLSLRSPHGTDMTTLNLHGIVSLLPQCLTSFLLHPNDTTLLAGPRPFFYTFNFFSGE